MNGSTMHIAILIGSDRAMNLALLLEVIRTMFFLLSWSACLKKDYINGALFLEMYLLQHKI